MSWSPDGQLLVTSYVMDEEITATVVVAAAEGAVLAHYDGLATLGSWTGDTNCC